jgi:hypothetical protein
MPLIQIPVGIAPCHVDFPETVKTGEKDAKGKPVMRKMERSCKGSMYLRPASTRNITDDELTYLRTTPEWKKLGMRLHVIKVKNVKGAATEAAPAKTSTPKAEAKAEAPKDEAKDMTSGSESGSGMFGGGKKKKTSK